ncbi:hypothetical protein JOC74_004357 [Bacillus capparidis]|uniref:Uncharacterized protein n=1 Tax=Bacillus capparidis TaxID=1840411 RepID=A0ABS4D2I4_9BACI|nr:hypothetical protein [Bacillus capparidis]
MGEALDFAEQTRYHLNRNDYELRKGEDDS